MWETLELCSQQGFCTYWSVTVLTAVSKTMWLLLKSQTWLSVSLMVLYTGDTARLSECCFSAIHSGTRNIEFNVCLMTGCRYCACRVWWGGLMWLCCYSCVVLSTDVFVYEKTWTARQHVSIHFYVKYCTVYALSKLFTQILICQPRYDNSTLGLNCLRFVRVRNDL